ncbi:MAG: HEAT repeat domain-containing protein [Halodesulfurarchaeum sp.]
MFFALKIIRFFFRLLLKLILLPFKLLKRLMGNEQSAEDWTTGEPEDWSSGDAGSDDQAEAATAETQTTGTGERNGASARAERNIRWFRKGLIAVGGIQLLVGLFGALNIARTPFGSIRPAMVGALLFAVIVVGIAPIGIGLGLSKWPKTSWYLGMAGCGILGVLSLFSLPGGLISLAIYGGLGYLGYTGRPALGTFSNADDTATDVEPAATDPIDQQSQPSRETASNDSPSRPDSPADRSDEPTEGSSTARTDAASGQSVSDPSTVAESASEPPEIEGERGTDDGEPDGTRGANGDTDPAETEGTAGQSDETTVDGNPVDQYRERLRADSPAERKSAVEDLVAAISTESVPSQSAIDALSARLDDDDPAVRAAACRGLGQLGAEQAKPKLKDLRLDPQSDVSHAASEALRNID